MKVKIITEKVSVCGMKKDNKGHTSVADYPVNDALNRTIQNIEEKGYTIVDIKMQPFVEEQHNNGGCNGVWMQYLIMYK